MNIDLRKSSKNPNTNNFPGIQVTPPAHEIPRKESSNRIQIFQRTKSNTKHSLKFQLTKSTNSNAINYTNPLLPLPSNASMRRKSRTIHGFDNDLEETSIKEIYKIKENEEIPKLIQKFSKINECSILKYGLKMSNEKIDFSFCRTCDPNLINPICAACIRECHKGHKYKKKFMKGEIKCICGERLHCMSKKPDLTNNNSACQLGEWYLISKLNFYYKTKDKKCYCMLCYNVCNNDKSKESIYKLKAENNDNEKVFIPNCNCNNEDVHQERKIFFEKMEEIAHNLDNYEYFNLLHPSQIINMIFLSKDQFKVNYSDLNYLNELIKSENLAESSEFKFFKKADFSSTNYYSMFNHLIEFIRLNRHTNITYYCKEAQDYFSFKRAKLILSLLNNMRHNEKSFCILSSKFLELFHKIYIGNITQSFSKFKLNDLENFSCMLRWLCCNLNDKYFLESQEIVNFLISILKNINVNGFSCIEAMDLIIIIITILKKMARYNLISNGDMIRIIQEIEKNFFCIKILKKIIFKNNQGNINIDKSSSNSHRNDKRMSLIYQKNEMLLYEKQIKLFYSIIKLILNFNMSFNDRLVHNILTNNHKYPLLDSINKDTVLFTFIKTDLGRSLIKLTIRVLYTIRNICTKYIKNPKIKIIMNIGIKILSCFTQTNDTYLLSLLQSLKKAEFYIKESDIDENINSEYKKIVEEKSKLEKCYKNFFIFEYDIDNVIQEVNNSLDNVLGEISKLYKNNTEKKTVGLTDKKILYILKSNYYFTLSKFYQILNFSEKKKENLPKNLKNNMKDNEENISNVIDKIFIFYRNFIYNSYDNSLLLMSNYIFRDLCKVPIKYGLINFELFIEAVQNIINNSSIIGNINNYLKNLFVYLEYLKDNSYSKINECLLIYLDIINLLALKIKSLNSIESINELKQIVIEINKNYKIVEKYFDNKSKGKDEKDSHKHENNILYYIKIINDIFDFTNEKEKKNVINIINPEEVSFSLKNSNITLNLRTEFLRFIRKIYIDLSYNDNSNHIYANSIISIDDNLLILKINPLITNLRYPTKLFSYFKDFLNLSIRSEMKEDLIEEIKSNGHPNKNYTFKYDNTKIDEIESSIFKKEKNEEEDEDKEDEKKSEENNNNENLYSEKSKSNSNSNDNSQKNNLKPCFDNEVYELFMNELTHVKEITSDIKPYIEDEMEKLRNYFENGLLIPIIYFLKKQFAFSHCFSGTEMIKLYELIIESCKLRLYIAEYKQDFWKEISDNKSEKNDKNVSIMNVLESIKEKENFYKIYNNKSSLINGNFCINNNLNIITVKAINLLKAKKFLCFDFTSLYNIFEQNILCLLKDRNINTYSECFINEGKEFSLKTLTKIENKFFSENKYMNETEKRIIRLYLLYKYSKRVILNENNSALFSILPEICLVYETNYRNLLINFLIDNGIKLDLNEDKVGISFYLLYKLLSSQTSETQNNLINIIGGNDIDENELGFMKNFSQYLFNKIVLLFIELFNPPDKLLDTNYISSFILIKIFKFLCEEHNNFFQCRLIKSLTYEYVEHTPVFYKEVSADNDSKTEDQIDSKYDSQDKKKHIKFFDFFLHVILKIILISEWDKLDYNDENYHRQNNYLYDIFEAILEMLNEIIQGNKPEYLNKLGNSIIDFEIENIDKLIDDMESKAFLYSKTGVSVRGMPMNKEATQTIEKVDTFQYFVKNVTDFIFTDRISIELLYKIRNNLMGFFTTILEEKNCNEEIQKFIIKYLNINKVLNSISSILKSYYINETSEEEMEKLLRTIKLDNNNNMDRNIGKRITSPQIFKEYNELYKLNSTYEKNSTKFKNDFSSKIFPFFQKDFMRTRKFIKNRFDFNDKILEFYRNVYFSLKEFNQTNEFKLSNAFYKYIKLISVLNKSEEAKSLIEQVESMSEETAKKKFFSRYINKKISNPNILPKKEIKQNIYNKQTINSANTNIMSPRKHFKAKNKNLEINKLNESELFELNIKKNNNEFLKKNVFSLKSVNNNNKRRESNYSTLINENINEYDRDSIEHYYIIKFFESITTTVEVRTEGAINQTVIFTQPPEMIYLSNGTKSEFEREVNRDSETSKKNDLVRHVIYFQKEIKFYQNNQSKLSRWVSKIDFLHVQIISYIYALLFNLLILFTLYGDTESSINDNEEESIQSRRTNSDKIQLLIDNSIKKWGKIYDIICYIYVIFNGVCILVWIYFRMPLYYKIDRLKYMEENNLQNKKNLKIYQKIYIIIIMTIYDRDYISTLIYEFIFSLIGAIMKRGEIIYAFLLLPVIDLNNILKNIIVSVKLQYNEVGLTFFFSAIIMYMFSNLAFFFFNNDFSQEIEYRDDNVCKNLIFCFMNTLDSGLRARGGIGDSAIRISYIRNKNHYIQRLILDDIFFILIVITAIDLVFGIIIGAFATLRNEEQKHSADRKNHCFICHVNKNTLEKNRQNFYEHRTKIHNLWNYVDYMITLKFCDLHDLNAINSYASQKIENKDISWLPTYKDLKNNGKNGKNDDHEEELKVEEENVNKYFVKTC